MTRLREPPRLLPLQRRLQVAAIFGAINLPSVGSWTLIGQAMARFLTSPRRQRVFNGVMAALLVASLYPMLL